MKKILFLLPIFIILLSSFSLASELEYFEGLVELNTSDADYTLTFLFRDSPEGTLTYPLSYKIKDFETSANFRNYTCEAQGKEWGTLIYCDFTKTTEEGRALSIRFRRPSSVEKIENVYHFETDIETPQDVSRMVGKVVLGKGFILISEPKEATTLVPFTPKDGTEGSDGRRIFVIWERNDLEKGEGLDMSLTYERTSPVPQDNMIFLVLGIVILVILLILGLRFKIEQPKGEDIERILKKDERTVIKIIKNSGGNCKQREIVRETDFSKAKVSRLIRDLEERGLIKVEKAGRTNKIYLSNNTSST